MKEKVFSAVLITALTTIASTLIVNTINDSRDLVRTKIEILDKKIEKIEKSNDSSFTGIQRLYQRIEAIRGDIRNLDSNTKYSRLETVEAKREFNEKLAKLERQLDEIKKRIRMY